MANLVIVALPAEDDYVNKISSQKIPHMTLLFLGDVMKVQNLSKILDFTSHAAGQSLNRFGLEVDRRGELGADRADVLFFSKSKWSGFETINEFRSYLLKEPNIRTAYDSIEQFSEWQPHLTLGYPDSPAKPDDRDYPGINYVNFDRIAVWFSEFAGIEFTLQSHDWQMDVAMDSVTPKDRVENILEHFGVKGMRWGVRRKATVGPTEVIVSDKRKKIKTSGGERRPASPDAVRARTIGQVGKKSGLKALSDAELSAYSKRLNLEQQVKRLEYNEKNAARRFVASLLGQSGKNAVQNAANEAASKAVKRRLAKGAVAAAL